jgi:hypothetical protein
MVLHIELVATEFTEDATSLLHEYYYLPVCDAVPSTINFTDVSEELTTIIFRVEE